MFILIFVYYHIKVHYYSAYELHKFIYIHADYELKSISEVVLLLICQCTGLNIKHTYAHSHAITVKLTSRQYNKKTKTKKCKYQSLK